MFCQQKLQLNLLTVLPVANLNCYDHMTCVYNFSFSNSLNVIYKLLEVKNDIFLVT